MTQWTGVDGAVRMKYLYYVYEAPYNTWNMFGKKINAMKRTSTKFYSDKPEPESENPQKPSVAALKNYKKICNESVGSKNSKNIG